MEFFPFDDDYVRRLREGGEFFGYLRERKQIVRTRQQQLQQA